MTFYPDCLRNSLTNRLLLLFIVVSVLIVVVLLRSLSHGFGVQWRGTIRPHLHQYLHYANRDLGYPPSRERAKQLADRLPINIYIHGPDGEFATNGVALQLQGITFHNRSGRRRHLNNREPRNTDHEMSPKRGQIAFADLRNRSLLRIKRGDFFIYYELQHLRSRADRHAALLVALLALLLILGLCYALLRLMLRPVTDISHGVGKMGAGHLDYRIPLRGNNDLGALAGSINVMAGDIQQMLDAKRQLLLGASHELRTPLTRARLATELLPDSEKRDSLLQDLAEMEKLIADILESERVKDGHAALNRSATDLERLVQSVLAELPSPGVQHQSPPPLPKVLVDATRLRILLRGLLHNATTHGVSPDGVLPILELSLDHRWIRFLLSDFGPGIESEHLPRLTEAFYRTDAARGRASGGYGLGLHLCGLIASAHGGTLQIHSTPGQGTQVEVRLPLVLAS